MSHIVQRVTLQLLRAYKWAISPMFPPACRYVPTCSEYAMEAIERYGALRGGLMAAVRLLRCHPFALGGYDPVVKHHPEASWLGSTPVRRTVVASTVVGSAVVASTVVASTVVASTVEERPFKGRVGSTKFAGL